MIEYNLKRTRTLPWLFPVFRSAKFLHRLELIKGPCYTIFITAPAIRTWGFLCPNKGWVHWSEFTDASGNQIGKGCDE